MSTNTMKSMKIAAILASAAIVYNVNNVSNEDEWILQQATTFTEADLKILNNESAKKQTEIDCEHSEVLNVKNEKCVQDNSRRIKYK